MAVPFDQAYNAAMDAKRPANTSLTLLDALCESADDRSWDRLVGLYSPLLHGWLVQYDVQPPDADDLVQDVLIVVMKEIPEFRHNERRGAFRRWLRQILVNRLQNFWRKRKYRPLAEGGSDFLRQLSQLEDDSSRLSQQWDREHDRHLLLQMLDQAELRFSEQTRGVFRRLALDGAEPQQVAEEMGMTLNAVILAKCRVLKHLRSHGKGLLGD